MRANVFSIGFGKEIAGWTDKRGTRWKWSLLPFGGYVQFAGDMDPSGAKSSEWLALPLEERNQTFQSKSLWKRAAIVFAGPAINFLLAIIIISGFLIAFGQATTTTVIGTPQAKSAAVTMGLQKGDEILSINGQPVDSFEEMAQEIALHPNAKAEFAILRDEKPMTLNGVIGARYEEDRFGNRFAFGMMGIPWPPQEMRDVPLYEVPVLAVIGTYDIVRTMITGLGQIISGRRPVEELGGPMKIAQYSGEQLEAGGAKHTLFHRIAVN